MKPISRRGFIQTAVAAGVAQALATRGYASLADTPAATEGLTSLSLAEASVMMKTGKTTATALVTACLDRIRIYDPKLEAYITITGKQALAEAAQLDEELKAGKLRGPLHGIPIAIKDNIDTAGVRTTAGSAVFDNRVPDKDAEVVRRLKAAGAIVIGKANLDEFAFGVSYFGSARNPWALDRDTGGSSSGPAVATAADLCFGSLGTDTACSIRMPASYCGVVGLKPTYGLVPLKGIIPLIPSLDHCGPLTRTVEDAALLLNAIAGYDKNDPTTQDHAREDYASAMLQPVSGFRIGIPRAPFFDLVDAEVAQPIEEAIRVIGRLTSGTREVYLPATNGIDLSAEIFAYQEEFFKTNASRYMLATRASLEGLQGEPSGSPGGCTSREDIYIRSRWQLDSLRRSIDDAFTDYDLVILPTLRHVPRTLDAVIRLEQDPAAKNVEADPGRDCSENNEPFNLYGIPAISVPCGFAAGRLPVGLMIAGPRFSEGKILALARAYERETQWHTMRPPLRPDTTVPPLPSRDEKR
jgi:aspartyl-tRNA(Asn)/glutamyl-tRNA(Gln) amidotransferase subunit A